MQHTQTVQQCYN